MVRTKVFVGNLDFKTKESELAKEFAVAGKVISANIITRGPRSLGYGFVEMDSEEDAKKAVELLNKKEVDGRPINVEVAKPREELQEQKAQQQAQQQQTGGEQVAPRGGRGGARGARGTRGTRGTRGGARGTRGGRGGARGGRGGAQTGQQPQQQQAQPQQPQQQKKEQEPRTPSKTTLFVANLPFAVDDEGFGKILKDNNLAFKLAKVVRNARSKRSKGFGFIEFDNEADQQKALAALNNKQVDGRELAVKVALTELKAEETPAPTQAQTQTKA